ncbi:hypothetical protein [Crassaminicella profunda]|uniref:hypothetical protein n=1 Tax=Crassaminicella profunda TaxID=1286698 RepID=UPI001CA75A94|nr:hypothetical protein [Crassaminicella profunda]QZY56405.1 hypothetical protein K7H06_05625 [Crassaminicella profunda]
MKKKIKKIMNIIFYIVVILLAQYAFPDYMDMKHDINTSLYKSYRNFKWYLGAYNENIAELLLTSEKNYEEIYNKLYLGKYTVFALEEANRYIFNKNNKDVKDDYIDFYLKDTREYIKNIIEDNIITDDEKKYLMILYDFNKKVIALNEEIEYDATKKLFYKGKNYMNFSEKVDTLLKSEKYAFLRNPLKKEKYESISVHEAIKLTQEIVDKVFPYDFKIVYDEKSQFEPDTYYFNSFFRNVDEFSNRYSFTYNKKYNIVDIDLSSWIVDKKVKSEKTIDTIAKDIFEKMDDGHYINYKRDVDYCDYRICDITYSYIRKIDDLYDETKQFELNIKGNGDFGSFRMENMLPLKNIKKPKLKKEEILSKLDKKLNVKKCILIRNRNSKLEYEVQININDKMYAIIFDANTGKQKYITRDIREY